MSQPQSFSVLISADLPADERDALVLALRDHVNLEESTPRTIDPEQARAIWEAFVAIMKDAGTVAGGAAAILALAEKSCLGVIACVSVVSTLKHALSAQISLRLTLPLRPKNNCRHGCFKHHRSAEVVGNYSRRSVPFRWLTTVEP